MKNLKILLPAFGILATVGIGFAFKSNPSTYTCANVYCTAGCTWNSLVDFMPDNIDGIFTKVCGEAMGGNEAQEYQLLGVPQICTPIALGQKYDQTIH